MSAGTELQKKLKHAGCLGILVITLNMIRKLIQFMLFDKNEKQDFQDEGAIYPATPQGINQLLNEVDSSRR